MLLERNPAESPFGGFPRNRLLAALSAADFDRMRPLLEAVEIRRRVVLQDFHQRLEHVYFIESGLASLQVQTDSDSPVEAGLVGRMGMIGAPVVLGTGHAPIRAIMEVPGEALRLSAHSLGALMAGIRPLRRLLLSYVQATTVQSSQLVLCNVRHDTDQRVARWLLLARDRLDSDDIPITHDLLSGSLGVRRSSVTDSVARLQAAHAVRATRGQIAVVSRRRLEDISCRCYQIIKAEYDQLLESRSTGEED